MKRSISESKQGTTIPFWRGPIAAALILAAFSGLPARAQQDDNPVDTTAILKALAQFQKTQAAASKTNAMQFANQFLTYAGSTSAAIDYYKQAVRATKLEGKSMESVEYQEWEKASAERFKSRSFRDALSFHLTYLALTLKHNAGVDMKILLPDLINYTQQVMADYDELGGRPEAAPTPGNWQRRGNQPGNANAVLNGPAAPAALDPELMNQALTGSVFVKWLQIDSYVSGGGPEGDDWEMTPGNVDGIYAKTILPAFRKTKDLRLLQYWDQRIQREGDAAAKTRLNYDVDKFNQITKPTLLWNRTQELLVLNQKNRAINEMLNIIKTYPAHPDAADWISQLQSVLSPPAPSPSPAPATSAPPLVYPTPPAQPQPGT